MMSLLCHRPVQEFLLTQGENTEKEGTAQEGASKLQRSDVLDGFP